MKRYLLFSIFSMLLISLFSCKSDKNIESRIIDFDVKPKVEISLKFEDIVEKVKIVKIETRDDLVLPEYISLEITQEYIITISDEEINQFDTKGNHISRLAVKGNGPNEFNNPHSIIDQYKNRLYVMNSRDGRKVLRVNLNTGEFLEPFTLDTPIYGYFVDDNENIVARLNLSYREGLGLEKGIESRIFFMSTDDGALKDIVIKGNEYYLYSYQDFMRDKKDMFYYDYIVSDTLYTFDENGATPFMIFKATDKAENEITDGVEIHLRNIVADMFVVNKENRKMVSRKIGNMGMTDMEIISSENFLLDKNGNLSHLSGFVIDKYNITLSSGQVPHSTGNFLYYCFSAPRAIALLEKALENETTTDKQRKEINALLSQIDEEDNHIIIYGKRK